MNDLITLTGLVATDPRVITTSESLSITSFRLASTQRRYSRAEQAWVDGDTNWYTISTFRQLAQNTAGSIRKGDRVVVSGRLRIRSWDTGEKSGTTIEIDADAVGHDLAWGTAEYSRTMSSSEGKETGGPDVQTPDAQAQDGSLVADAQSGDAVASETPGDDTFEPELQATSQVATPF